MVKQVHGVVTIENFLQIKKKSGPSCMQFLDNGDNIFQHDGPQGNILAVRWNFP